MPILINNDSGLAEDVAQTPETVQTHSIPLTDPEGNSTAVPEDQAAALLQQGFRQPNEAELGKLAEHAHYNSTSQEAKTALEGLAEGVAGPLATGAERAVGVNPEDIRKRQEYNPGIHAAGTATGLVGSMATGLGEGAVLMDAGKAAEKLVGEVAGKGALAKIGAGAAKGIVENAIYTAGDEVSKLIKNDPEQSMETALADIGLSAAFGAAGGGAFGAGGAAWDALMEGKAGSYAKGLKDTLNKYTPTPSVASEAEETLAPTPRVMKDPFTGKVRTIESTLSDYEGPKSTLDPFTKKPRLSIAPKIIEEAPELAKEEIKSGANFAEDYIKRAVDKYMKKDLGITIGTTLGTIVGHPFPGYLLGVHAIQPILDSVLPALTRSISEGPASGVGLKAALNFGKAVLRGDTKLNDAAKAIFEGGKIDAGSDMADELHHKLMSASEHPEHLLDSGTDVGHYMPAHAQALGQHIANATQYLNSLRPSTESFGPLDAPRTPNAVEIAKYRNALNIAQNPTLVMKKIQNGTLTLEDVQHLNTLSPKLAASMRQKITDAMITHTSKDGTVPYQTRIMASMFLGQPLDASMHPSYIMASQPQQPQEQPRQQHKLEKLGKSNSYGFSPMQASEARHLKV